MTPHNTPDEEMDKAETSIPLDWISVLCLTHNSRGGGGGSGGSLHGRGCVNESL